MVQQHLGPILLMTSPEPTLLDRMIHRRLGVPLATHSDAAAADAMSRIPYWEFATVQGPFRSGSHQWGCLPYRATTPPPPSLGGVGMTKAQAQCECIQKVLEFCDGLEEQGETWWREQFASLVGLPGINKATPPGRGQATLSGSLIRRGQRPGILRRFANLVFGKAYLNEQAGIPGQQCWCWCPGCDYDLCAQPDNVLEDVDGAAIVFECRVCGTVSHWDFYTSPIPLLIDEPGDELAPGELSRIETGTHFLVRDRADYIDPPPLSVESA